jgi:hypothetical protein
MNTVAFTHSTSAMIQGRRSVRVVPGSMLSTAGVKHCRG